MVSPTTVLGAAGEHYVMCQLLRHGMIAALAPIGVPNTDVVVTDNIGARVCAIQVKTRVDKGADGGWHMGVKHETLISPNLFYVFVDFGKTPLSSPISYIVPSVIVADVVSRSHEVWLQKPGKNGQMHKDGDLRRFLPNYDKVGIDIGCGEGWLRPYLENWHVITSVKPDVQ